MIRESLVKLVKGFEGCRLTAYKDIGGIWTIGYGSTGRDVIEGTQWTQEHADMMLILMLTQLRDSIIRNTQVPVTDNQLDALTSLVYNIGVGAYKDSTLRKLLDKMDYTGAANQFLRWNHVNGVIVIALTKRRKKEKELFLT